MQLPNDPSRREPDESYFARRAAEHRRLTEGAGDERTRAAHRQFAAVYERHAMRALLERHLG